MITVLGKLNNGILRIMEVVIVVLALVMVLSCFLQICVRLLAIPMPWTEELARYVAVWLTFVGAPYALAKGSLVGVDMLYESLSGIKKKILFAFISIMIFVFAIIMIVYGNAFANMFLNQLSPVLGIPRGFVYYVAVVCGVSLFLFQAEIVLKNFFAKEVV